MKLCQKCGAAAVNEGRLVKTGWEYGGKRVCEGCEEAALLTEYDPVNPRQSSLTPSDLATIDNRGATLNIQKDITAYESALLTAWLVNAASGITIGLRVPAEIARHFTFPDGDSAGPIKTLEVPSHPKP